MMNLYESIQTINTKYIRTKRSNNILSTTWTGITLLPGAFGAQVLDLLGPWHNCTGLIKSILRCKLSADDFRRAGLRRVTDSLFGGRGDTGPPVLGDPTSGREPNGLDLRPVLHQEALGYLI